ncbi:hypothetical protein A2U01_0112916, partial [Trifolium medium]|nr:hypothetical protein [Trifolium medium]
PPFREWSMSEPQREVARKLADSRQELEFFCYVTPVLAERAVLGLTYFGDVLKCN